MQIFTVFVATSYQFASCYLENLGNGHFLLHPLSLDAQFSPTYGIQTDDFNGDGFQDAVLVGNSHSTDVTTGQYDASEGLLLQGDGKGNFTSVSITRSKFIAEQVARSVVMLQSNEYPLYLIINNDDKVEILQNFQSKRWFVAGKNEASIVFKIKMVKLAGTDLIMTVDISHTLPVWCTFLKM